MAYPKRKYRKGYLVLSIGDLLWGLDRGEWFYWNDKVLHPGFFLNMRLGTIAGALKKHIIADAIDQHKECNERYIESIVYGKDK